MSGELRFDDFIGESRSLFEWLSICREQRGLSHWLLYQGASGDLDGDTEMFPVSGDVWDLSNEQFDWFDAAIRENGYSSFLNLDQLEDVIDNLGLQRQDYSNTDLIDAVKYYFARDAFIVVSQQ